VVLAVITIILGHVKMFDDDDDDDVGAVDCHQIWSGGSEITPIQSIWDHLGQNTELPRTP